MDVAFPSAGPSCLRAKTREALVEAIFAGLPGQGGVVAPQLLDFDLESLASRYGLTVTRVAARLFHHDLAALADAVRTDTVMLYLTNPNELTGTRLPAALLENFFALLPAQMLVVLDETAASHPMEKTQGAFACHASRVWRLRAGNGAQSDHGADSAATSADASALRYARQGDWMQDAESLLAAANLQYVPTTTGSLCFRAPDAAGLAGRLRSAGLSADALGHAGMSGWLRVRLGGSKDLVGFGDTLQEFLKG